MAAKSIATFVRVAINVSRTPEISKLSSRNLIVRQRSSQVQNAAIFRSLKLKKFTRSEISEALRPYTSVDGYIKKDEIRRIIENSGGADLSTADIDANTDLFISSVNGCKTGVMKVEDVSEMILKRAEVKDPRVNISTLALVISGVGIGMQASSFPGLCRELALSPIMFGSAVSLMGVTRILGNFPTTFAVNALGRNPTMTLGTNIFRLFTPLYITYPLESSEKRLVGQFKIFARVSKVHIK